LSLIVGKVTVRKTLRIGESLNPASLNAVCGRIITRLLTQFERSEELRGSSFVNLQAPSVTVSDERLSSRRQISTRQKLQTTICHQQDRALNTTIRVLNPQAQKKRLVPMPQRRSTANDEEAATHKRVAHYAM